MSRQYDAQLIESVAVRRRRLREAWLFGDARFRHTLDEGVTKMFASVAVAAVVCAGCVGYSFIQAQRGDGGSTPSPGVTVTPSDGSSNVPTPGRRRTPSSPSS
jgi:hypothetical protein